MKASNGIDDSAFTLGLNRRQVLKGRPVLERQQWSQRLIPGPGGSLAGATRLRCPLPAGSAWRNRPRLVRTTWSSCSRQRIQT